MRASWINKIGKWLILCYMHPLPNLSNHKCLSLVIWKISGKCFTKIVNLTKEALLWFEFFQVFVKFFTKTLKLNTRCHNINFSKFLYDN